MLILIYVDILSYLHEGIMLEHHFASRLRRDHAMPTLISQRVEEGGIPAGISQAEREARSPIDSARKIASTQNGLDDFSMIDVQAFAPGHFELARI